MQYLLTQAEFNDLTPNVDVALKTQALEAARKIILHQARIVCIHDDNPVDEFHQYGLCDDCPCSSNRLEGISYTAKKQLCTLRQEYSQ